MGIFDRLGMMGTTDVGRALASSHEHFQERINTHGHFGRAFVESIAHFCRNHPNLAGIAVGVLVEQLLVHEKHHHEQEEAEKAEAVRNGTAPPPKVALPRAAPHHTPHHMLRFARIRPGRLAMEVFGALVLLKFSTGVAHLFQRRKHRSSLGTVAKIRLISGTFGTYFTAKALKSHEVSALRNGLAMFFATRALKPLLRPDYSRAAADHHNNGRELRPEPAGHHPQAAHVDEGFSLDQELHRPDEGRSLFH